MESTSVPATHCQATYTNNIPAPSYQPRRLRVPPAPHSSGKAPTLHYLHGWQHKFLFWRWWWPIPRIWNRLLILTHILPVAVAVGKVVAAIFWHLFKNEISFILCRFVFRKIASVMTIINKAISRKILAEMAQNFYGEMIKGVVDINRRIMALDAELHSDLERLLLEDGSDQESLWGINLYPGVEGDDFIEFDSLINISPRRNNFSRDVEDDAIRSQIRSIVNNLIK